jgi:hypothetical protein
MTSTLRLLAMLAMFAASPALAAEPDAYAAHHPAGAAPTAPPAAGPDTEAASLQGCQMMKGQMMGKMNMPAGAANPAMAGIMPAQPAPGTASSGMMMAGKGMPCMPMSPAPGARDQQNHPPAQNAK